MCSLALQIRQDYRKISELDQHLAAGAARRARWAGVGDHGEAFDGSAAGGDDRGHGVPFGADTETVGSVFDIATHVDAAFRVNSRRPYREARVRSMGSLPDLGGSFNETINGLKTQIRHDATIPLKSGLRFGRRPPTTVDQRLRLTPQS
jgi:hypothetical protein